MMSNKKSNKIRQQITNRFVDLGEITSESDLSELNTFFTKYRKSFNFWHWAEFLRNIYTDVGIMKRNKRFWKMFYECWKDEPQVYFYAYSSRDGVAEELESLDAKRHELVKLCEEKLGLKR